MKTTLDAKMLTAWRERMGFSYDDAIRQLGCELQEWSDWENGKQPIPRYVSLAIDALTIGLQPYGFPPIEYDDNGVEISPPRPMPTVYDEEDA
jgi:transcriptional regulator with XRE-family HTH domain